MERRVSSEPLLLLDSHRGSDRRRYPRRVVIRRLLVRHQASDKGIRWNEHGER